MGTHVLYTAEFCDDIVIGHDEIFAVRMIENATHSGAHALHSLNDESYVTEMMYWRAARNVFFCDHFADVEEYEQDILNAILIGERARWAEDPFANDHDRIVRNGIFND